MKTGVALLASALLLASATFAADPLRTSPEIDALRRDFPVLANLLVADHPWEQEPAVLARAIFARPPKIAQGSPAHPLLLQDQREWHGWPGEKVFDQLSYESEYYVFDRMNPVIKLHVGRPLVFAMQHGRGTALGEGTRPTGIRHRTRV